MKIYRVAQDENYQQFLDEVNEALADGWEPQGGVAVRNQPDGDPVLYQALTKVEE
jgi:hypothetical protein